MFNKSTKRTIKLIIFYCSACFLCAWPYKVIIQNIADSMHDRTGRLNEFIISYSNYLQRQ
tara:strand:+ start:137 stop:316 length:180 start_codon:yes stop_codon:yes gene_type:complete